VKLLADIAIVQLSAYNTVIRFYCKCQTKHTIDTLNLVGVTSPTSPANSQAAQHPISPTIFIQPCKTSVVQGELLPVNGFH
jgi:hypothetical protein